MFYSFKRGRKIMAVERSALGRERERKEARDAFYPCCALLYPRRIICPLEHCWSSQLPSAPHEILFCRASLRQEKPVLLPRISGWNQSNPVVPLHPSSCPERTICCPVLLLLAIYCISSCLRVGKAFQYGTSGKIRILCHIYYVCNFELLQNVVIKS